MNIIDKAVSFFSPAAGYRRIAFRKAIATTERAYDAAGHGRRNQGRHAPNTSANQETQLSLPVLRARSRELVRNNPYAKRALQNITTNTVGKGIRPTPDVKAKGNRARIKNAWKAWAESTECDYNGEMTFYGIQRMVMRSATEGGGCLVRLHRTKDRGVIPIKLQVLESDFIDTSRDIRTKPGEGFTIQGVKFDAAGHKLGYYLYKQHPGDGTTIESEFVPANEVLYVYYVERPGQVHGVPFGASAMLRLRDFDDYEDAQLMRQKVAACFSVFITDTSLDADSSDKPKLEKLEPAIIEELPAGKSVTFASPPPADGYTDYSRNVLRAIAAGYGTTYEAMTGDLSNVNFSSGRMGWLEFQRLISEWQEYMLLPMLCNKVWSAFIEGGVIAGIFPASTSKTPASWTFPAREMIDPVKEIKGKSEEVRNGFMSWQEAVREFGRDPETVMQQMKEDAEAFTAMGLFPVCDPRFDVNRTNDPVDGKDSNKSNDPSADEEEKETE